MQTIDELPRTMTVQSIQIEEGIDVVHVHIQCDTGKMVFGGRIETDDEVPCPPIGTVLPNTFLGRTPLEQEREELITRENEKAIALRPHMKRLSLVRVLGLPKVPAYVLTNAEPT